MRGEGAKGETDWVCPRVWNLQDTTVKAERAAEGARGQAMPRLELLTAQLWNMDV